MNKYNSKLRTMAKNLTILLVALSATRTSAFVAPAPRPVAIATSSSTTSYARLFSAATDKTSEVDDAPNMNPDNPALPALKGDYDWDAEFAADEDWITENVPGKIVINEVELAAQVTELTKLEDAYRKVRKEKEYTQARIIGFVPQAEMYNGRAAMFFLVVGLLTELWTGISIPGQIEEMARVGGFIGPDF
jgi:hypothetical protein